jgi:hypothetical protein
VPPPERPEKDLSPRMPQRPKQERILLDWFNVSYRTLLVAGLALLVVGTVAILYFLGILKQAPSPRGQAYAAITDADDLLRKATAVEGTNLDALRDEARTLLVRAREAFGEANYSDAMKSAVESANASRRLLSIGQGEGGLPDVQFYKIEGNVQVKRARELIWKNAAKTTPLDVGDQIKTDSSASAQIIYFNGTITTIKPGSILEIKELYDDPATRVQKVRETLRTGTMISSTQEVAAAGSFHEVSTESASVRAEGRSEFETRFDEINGGTSVGVYRGGAVVRSGGGEVQLAGREGVQVDAGGTFAPKVKLPPTPVLLEPIDQKIFNAGAAEAKPVTIQLSWEPSGSDGTYHLQISSTSLFGDLLLDRPDLKQSEVTLPPTEAGSYYWRVSFRDSSGVDSAFSETRKFKVLAGRVMNADDTTPPDLSIDDFLVFSTQVIVRGRTEPGAILAANGKTIDVGDDGAFTTIIQLRREGRNEIRFVAQDAAGNERSVTRVAEVRPL